MTAAPSLEILNSALAPVEVLRGEQTQLESSLRESFTELEALNDELTEWQRELTRQQAELDQRAAAIADAEDRYSVDPGELVDLQQQLILSQEYSRQLEEENAGRLQAVEDLQRQLAAAHADLQSAQKHAQELSETLATERERAIGEHRMWSGELRDMHRLLERQGAMLESLGADFTANDDGNEGRLDGEQSSAEEAMCDEKAAEDDAARPAESRRRGSNRRHRRRLN